MTYTDARAWLDAHELIECKPLKGLWTPKTCFAISQRAMKAPRNAKSQLDMSSAKTIPCGKCPIMVDLEK